MSNDTTAPYAAVPVVKSTCTLKENDFASQDECESEKTSELNHAVELRPCSSSSSWSGARTRQDLAQAWKTIPPTSNLVAFYGHDPKRQYASFSNFFIHPKTSFRVPDCCWERLEGVCSEDNIPPRVVNVRHSEKSIMLCKAAAMKDVHMYWQILSADEPAQAKKLGRMVTPFDEDVWQTVLLTVAYECVVQKFRGLVGRPECDELLATGDLLIVEAARRDRIWGIGMGANDVRVGNPRKWGDGNVLGWALMQARETIRNEIGSER